MKAIQGNLLCQSCGWKLAYYNNDSPDTSRWYVVCENDSEHCGNSGVKYRVPTVELVPVETATEHKSRPTRIVEVILLSDAQPQWLHGVLSDMAPKPIAPDANVPVPESAWAKITNEAAEENLRLKREEIVRGAESQKLDNHLRAILKSKDCEEVDRLMCQWRDETVLSCPDPQKCAEGTCPTCDAADLLVAVDELCPGHGLTCKVVGDYVRWKNQDGTVQYNVHIEDIVHGVQKPARRVLVNFGIVGKADDPQNWFSGAEEREPDELYDTDAPSNQTAAPPPPATEHDAMREFFFKKPGAQ